MTTLSAERVKPEVAKALVAICGHFGADRVEVFESSCGGAYVIVNGVPLGPPYRQADTWIAFFITNACPFADVYPFYVRPDLSRIDDAALKLPLHINHTWQPDLPNFPGRPAVMVSRRTKPGPLLGLESPLLKLQRVIEWIRGR